ncbi:hypothetical protein GJ496_006903 [Pomphorhynchus laevis]|nr:hypothetical protein GJ496_006903 [Pomphorhynchus laevis]
MSALPLLAIHNSWQKKRAKMLIPDNFPLAIMEIYSPEWYQNNLTLHRIISQFNLFEGNAELDLVGMARSLKNCKYTKDLEIIKFNLKTPPSSVVIRKRGSVSLFTFDRHENQSSDVVNEELVNVGKNVYQLISEANTPGKDSDDEATERSLKFINFRVTTMLFVLKCVHSLHLIKLNEQLKTCIMLKCLDVLYEPEINVAITVKDSIYNCKCGIYASGKICISTKTKKAAEYTTSLLSPVLWKCRLNPSA